MGHMRSFYGKKGRVSLYKMQNKNYNYLVITKQGFKPEKGKFFDMEEALSDYKDNVKRVW